MSYLKEDIDVVTKIIKEMQTFSNEHQLELHYLNFYHQLIQFSSEFDEIVASARSVIANNIFKNISKERRRILEFIARVIDSEIFTQYCKYRTLCPLCSTDREIYSDIEYSEEFQKQLSWACETIKDRLQKNMQRKLSDFKQEEEEKLALEKARIRKEIEDEYKSTLEDLSQRLISSQEEISKEKASNSELQTDLSDHSALIKSLKDQLKTK
jgi:hypothetical protein